MNSVKSVIAGLAIIASGAAVSDSWYLGEAVSHYVLDDRSTSVDRWRTDWTKP